MAAKRGGKRPNYFKGEGWDPDALRNFDASPLTFPTEMLPAGLREAMGPARQPTDDEIAAFLKSSPQGAGN